MKIKSFSTNFRAGCAGLTAALMLLSSTSAYAQNQQGDAVQSNGSTKVLPPQSGGGGGAGGVGGNITAAIAQSGGAGSTEAAATIAAIQAAAGGGAAAGDALTTSLTNAGVAPGLAANLAVVATLTPGTVASILADRQSSLPTPNRGNALTASLSKSTGTLVASSEPMFVAQAQVAQAQNTTSSAVREAYDAITQAFIAGGVDATNAQRNAANVLIALASVKYAAPLGGGVNIGQVNRIATLIQPALAATPGMRKAITDNPNLSLTTFRNIQATIGILEPMALLVRVVNENV